MDRYVTVTKPSRSSLKVKEKCTNPQLLARFTPYPPFKPNSQENAISINKSEAVAKDKARLRRLLVPLKKDSVSAKPCAKIITKHLLDTLTDESNPITHSNLYERSDHVVSSATGHQRSEMRGGGHRRGYLNERYEKLEVQKLENARDLYKESEQKGGVLSGVRVYINGYLTGTTDIEMKRIVAGAGGITLLTSSGATHILTSQQLSGSKTHKHLTLKTSNGVYVVRPEWVLESVRKGRRLREWEFGAIKTENAVDLTNMFCKKEL